MAPISRAVLVTCAALVALLLPAAPSGAAITVTSLADSGPGSFRQAIADAAPNEDVDFAVEGTIRLASPLVVAQSLRVHGPGARRLAISGNQQVQVLEVRNFATTVELSDLTLRDGLAKNEAGNALGGALLINLNASVTATRVAVLNSRTESNCCGDAGGGIAVIGSLTLVDSTVAGNRSEQGGGIGAPFGVAHVAITNSTIAGNEALLGGGVSDGTDSHADIADSTIARNTATVMAGGIRGNPVNLSRSLVTANSAPTGPACDKVTSQNGNVVDSLAGCAFTAGTGDVTDVPALVGTLGDHGGPTDTIVPLPGNPAIDRRASPCAGPGFDQRSVVRPQGTSCDAGAVEARAGALAVAPGALSLARTRVGTRSGAATAALTNAGDLPVRLDSVAFGGANATEFDWLGGGCTAGVVLGSVESCGLTARLVPTRAGSKSAAFTIDPDGALATLTVPVAGTAFVDPPVRGPAPLASAVAQLRGDSVRANAKGVLRPKLRCTAERVNECVGTLTLRIGSRLLTAPYSVPAGETARLRLRLPRRLRRTLAREGFLLAKVTTVTERPGRSARTVQKTVVLRAPG